MALPHRTRTDPDVLRMAMVSGETVDLRTGDPRVDDPAQGSRWDQQRTVPAETLIEVLTSPDQTQDARRPRVLLLAGAKITGMLNLEAAQLVCPITFQACWFEQLVNLAQATVPAMRLPGSHLPALRAENLRTIGNLGLDQGFTSTGEVTLLGAHIGGDLVMGGARLTNGTGPALYANRLTVGLSMFCRDGFIANGEIRMVGAHIGARLSFATATLLAETTPANPSALALQAEGLRVDQDLFFTEEFRATG